MAIAGRIACEVDVVVAIGGDGTINEVVNGMAACDAPECATGAVGPAEGRPAAGDPAAGEVVRKAKLGIVPAGTVNVLALELGLPFQVERACNAIAEGKTISLDVGRVNDRGFVLMTGAGIDALTVRNIDPRQKKRFKELAFVGTGLRWGLAADPPAFVVRTEGVGVHGDLLRRQQLPLLLGAPGGHARRRSDRRPAGFANLHRNHEVEPGRLLAGCAERASSSQPEREAPAGHESGADPAERQRDRLFPDGRRAGRQAAGHGENRRARIRGGRAVTHTTTV